MKLSEQNMALIKRLGNTAHSSYMITEYGAILDKLLNAARAEGRSQATSYHVDRERAERARCTNDEDGVQF